MLLRLLWIILLFIPLKGESALLVGVGKSEITPPIGTPSAGYIVPSRIMTGVHDPLLAVAIVIDNGEKKLAFCSVDHLGFDHKMVDDIRAQLEEMEIIIASSHTHSGAGAYLDMPVIGEMLAGPYDPKIRKMLVDQTVKAIKEAIDHLQEASIGFGYGKAAGLNRFRSSWPQDASPSDALAVIKCVSKEGKTLAILFNYAVHPTVLSASNTLYSADFVASARNKIENEEGGVALYMNGAQGDVGPNPPRGNSEYEKCQALGEALADYVIALTNEISLNNACSISFIHYPYTLEVKPTATGMKLPCEDYDSELNAVIFNHTDAFVTIPGELSCLYEEELQTKSPFPHTSIIGLANDAHGYILTPDAFEHKTHEASLSFGGPSYGDWMVKQLLSMLQKEESVKDQDPYLQQP